MMIKSNKHIPYLKIRIDKFVCAVLILLIAFTASSDLVVSFDFELEKIEKLADGEKENKQQEKLDKSEKDLVLNVSDERKLLSRIKPLFINRNNMKVRPYYLKIPTPPPDFI